jgi:hypothetical protein
MGCAASSAAPFAQPSEPAPKTVAGAVGESAATPPANPPPSRSARSDPTAPKEVVASDPAPARVAHADLQPALEESAAGADKQAAVDLGSKMSLQGQGLFLPRAALQSHAGLAKVTD